MHKLIRGKYVVIGAGDTEKEAITDTIDTLFHLGYIVYMKPYFRYYIK